MKLTELERTFETYWNTFAPTGMREMIEPQYRFTDQRRFRLDFAIPEHKIAIELNGAGGGGFGRTIKCHACGATVRARKKGGAPGKVLYVPYPSHAKGDMLAKDAEKINLLTTLGWRIFVITPQLLNRPEDVINQIVEVMKEKHQ